MLLGVDPCGFIDNQQPAPEVNAKEVGQVTAQKP